MKKVRFKFVLFLLLSGFGTANCQTKETFPFVQRDSTLYLDVARHPRSGRKVLLLAEGNTPARSIHLLRNSGHPFRSPWFVLDEKADRLRFSVFRFKPEELRHLY